MHLTDIPYVMAIERRAFPLAWTSGIYRRELAANPWSHYLVLRPLTSNLSSPVPIHPLPPSIPSSAKGSYDEFSSPKPPLDVGGRMEGGERLTPLLSYGGVWQMDNAGHIPTIATHPDFAGRKLGSYVLVHLLLKAYAVGCSEATLEVRVSNTTAQALYARYGFEEAGRRRRYYSNDWEDALIMTRPTLEPAALLEELAATEAAVCARWSATTASSRPSATDLKSPLLPTRSTA